VFCQVKIPDVIVGIPACYRGNFPVFIAAKTWQPTFLELLRVLLQLGQFLPNL
jgi:hypothetical protein